MSEVKRPQGRPPVGPRIAASVDPDLLEILRERADQRHRGNLAAAVRDVLRRGLENDEEERATA